MPRHGRVLLAIPQGPQQLVVAQHVEQPKNGRLGCLDAQALADQALMLLVVEIATVRELPLDSDELAARLP